MLYFWKQIQQVHYKEVAAFHDLQYSIEKVTVQQDVMDPRMRHTIYHKMGFRLLDFEYVMPPLGKGYEKLKVYR